MASTSQSKTIEASPEAVWRVIGDPASLADWHPAISSSPVDGEIRMVELADGGTIRERITETGDSSYSYEFLESPLPIHDASGTISVEADDGGTTVTWEVSFEPDDPAREAETVETFNGIYAAGLQEAAQRVS